MSGSLMQLVAYGAQDVYLTGNPQITFFKVAYRRHTNFSMQAMNVVASGAAGFEKVMNFTIPRNGDLIMNTYLKAQIRDVEAVEGSTEKFAFVKRLGHALIDYATLTIGGSQIDKQYGMWLDLWYELTHKKSQEKGYKQMIGEIDALTKMSPASEGKKGYTVFVPLQFWFCRNPGLALPLIALQYHEVKVELRTARKDSILVYTPGFKNTDAYKHIDLGDVSLLVNYVFLDSEERRKFAQVGHEYLIEQLQFTGSVPVPTTKTTKDSEIHHSVLLNFNHPSKELVWAVRNGNTMGKTFLTYTADEDWSAALDEAAETIATSMFALSAETVPTTPGTWIKSDAPELAEKLPELKLIVAKEGEEGPVEGLYVNVDAFTIEGSALAKKIKSVSVTVGTDKIEKVDVFSHSLTIRDISIPLDKYTNIGATTGVVVNIPFNYGMMIDGSVNPVSKGLIQFNGQDRFDEREGLYFNCVQPHQHHTASPADGVNVYSFALNPENHQPSGSANLSRIDTTYLQLKYKDTTQAIDSPDLSYFNADSQLFVFDFSYNVLRVMSGMGGLAYSN